MNFELWNTQKEILSDIDQDILNVTWFLVKKIQFSFSDFFKVVMYRSFIWMVMLPLLLFFLLPFLMTNVSIIWWFIIAPFVIWFFKLFESVGLYYSFKYIYIARIDNNPQNDIFIIWWKKDKSEWEEDKEKLLGTQMQWLMDWIDGQKRSDLVWYVTLLNALFFCFIIAVSFQYPIISIPLFIASWLLLIIPRINPLFNFGNLWEKIQSLTPQIESQSQLIQSEFRKDMNFGVLHSWFEKLSSTFSIIISYILKLEKFEQKANMWNLFDSTKYINSLRSDILTPLISLKSFLEKQKQGLMASQRELSRVRIWWSEEESANRELASKRSESLIIELEKNILSLDEMILKME